MKEFFKSRKFLYLLIVLLLITNIYTGRSYWGMKLAGMGKHVYQVEAEDTETFKFFKPITLGMEIRSAELSYDKEAFKKVFPDPKQEDEINLTMAMWLTQVDNYYKFSNGHELVDKLLEEEGDKVFKGLNVKEDQILWLRENLDAQIRDKKTRELLLKGETYPKFEAVYH